MNINDTQYVFEVVKKKMYLSPLDSRSRQIGPKDVVTVSVNRKSNLMNFGKKALEAMGMNGSFYKLYFNLEENTIAWKVRKELDFEKLKELDWRLCKADSYGQATISIVTILRGMKNLTQESYKSLIVKKFQDKESLIDNDFYYMIEVKDQKN